MTWIIRIISMGTVLKEPFNDPLRISPLGGIKWLPELYISAVTYITTEVYDI